jgi:hypothetical protein
MRLFVERGIGVSPREARYGKQALEAGYRL